MKSAISLKLLESNAQIQIAILNAMLPQVDSFMTNVMKKIESDLPDLINEAIISQPEYNSLLNGTLKLELGIPDPEQRIQELLSIWIKNIDISYQKPKIVSSKIKSSISIKAIKADFSDVLGNDLAEVVDFNTGSVIPWLDWLLLEGSTTLVKDYEVSFGPNPRSRTGYAIMVDSNSDWKVPSEYSGTRSDNWITRAINSYKDNINKLLQKALSI
jgi:hypothetical protein